MDNSTKLQSYLSDIEKELEDLDQLSESLSRDLDSLKSKQQSLADTVKKLKDQLLHKPQNTLHLSDDKDEDKASRHEEMAREITKEDKKVIQLKNGQVSIPFEEFINLQAFTIPTDVPIEFDGIEQLKWDENESKFSGVPTEPGELIGNLFYWTDIEDKINGLAPTRKEVHFLVNPDPRSLWKNIEPPEDGLYYKSNTEFDLQELETMRLTAASVRGKSHAHKGTFRDDDFRMKHWKDSNWVLQVVADGAGSAEFSRQGSKIACETCLKEISSLIESPALKNLERLILERYQKNNDTISEELGALIYQMTVGTAFKAHKAIAKFAEQESLPLKSFATTLIFALSKQFDFGAIVINFSVGDGAIGVIQEKEAHLIIKPDGGEFSGQTCFLTMPSIFKPNKPEDIRNRYAITCYTEEVSAIVVMTDGISDPKFETENNLNNSEHWLSLWNDLKPVLSESDATIEEALFSWMDFYIPGEYDDRTISILHQLL